IDDRGEPLASEQLACILALLALRTAGSGTIVAPVSASERLGRVVASQGGRLVLTRADTAAVVRAALRQGALLGCDETGGFVWPAHLGAYDAMYTLLRAIAMLVDAEASLSDLRRELPSGSHLEREVGCPWEFKGEVMRRLVARHVGDRIDLTDGLKVDVGEGWVLVLPNADRPSYRVIVSTQDAARAEELLEQFVGEVTDTVARTSAPTAVPAGQV
ncbi:MAG: hypothetical protein ACREN7_08560, partial [Candidatus Dormibacteria bacterium]